jgi:uncharacterized protein (TIGR03435 family)
MLAELLFVVASVKPSERVVGPDYGNRIVFSPVSFSAKNATLKRLVSEAYDVRPFQVAGGPKWLDAAEYDVEVRVEAGEELRPALQQTLRERFHLALHRESREMKVYSLLPAAGGAKLKPGEKTMDQFAAFLGVQLSIHGIDDPSKPGMAASTPVPVVNRTGLDGRYDLNVEVRPEPGAEMFTPWQRALRDELGLRLESGKASVEMLLVDAADKTPTAN